MKTLLQILFLKLLALLVLNLNGQHHHCAHDSLLQLRNQQYPHIDEWENEQIKEFKKYNPILPNYPKPQTPPDCEICPLDIDPECVHTRYMLPVLVHIVAQPGHTTIGSQSNIPESQVLNAIATLNKQFSAQDISHPAAVNTGIQFYLAPVGPNSNGIFRYNNSISTDSVFAFSRMRGLIDSQYNNNNYIHIFVVDGILMSGVKGYATYPGGFNQAIVVQRRRFGNALNCSGCELDTISRNNVLAHELGHFLNLHHTFYNGCDTGDCSTSGDKCCDTPPVSSPNYTCDTVNTCSGSPNDLIENFMDYTPETCAYLFTRDQMLRMHAALENYRTGRIHSYQRYERNLSRTKGFASLYR